VQALWSDSQLREQVINLVQKARLILPDLPSTTDIQECYRLVIQEEILPYDKEGAYLDQESKIIINKLITSEERRRFTLYHELVHHLIRLDDDLYSYIHDAYPKTPDFDRVIELVCNIGAAELILPREIVRNLVDQKGLSLNLLQELCEIRMVSGPAALIQLVQYASNQCYGVVCERRNLKDTKDVKQQTFVPDTISDGLYILYAIWSPSVQYSLARYTIIQSAHLLSKVTADQKLVKGLDRIPFRSGKEWQVPCEVVAFRNKVYGLFHVTQPPDLHQPRLF
jgi:Zn-dependent peptidase ImmA (M78 family)